MPPEPTDDTVKALVRRHWDGRADTFDDEQRHGIHTAEQRERWLSVLRRWTGDEPLRVLDVGCGTGVVSSLLAALGHDVTGIDFAPGMLDRAREKSRERGLSIDVFTGDAENLPLSDDAVDLIAARHLLWTLPAPVEAIREWCRVARPGGRLLLIEGHWDHPEPWDEYEEIHADLPLYHGRPPGELVEFLDRHGLGDVEREPLMDPVLWGREPHHDYYVAGATVPR